MPKLYENKDGERVFSKDFKEPSERDAEGVAPPVVKDDSVFVSIVSYRDGERCAETIKSIFLNAKHPEKVVVGVVEQIDFDDAMCIDEYCKSHGVFVFEKDEKIKKLVRKDNEAKKCPRLSQIRLLSTNQYAARGPTYARSLMRKLLGNEEFCLQIDAHSTMAPDWDVNLTREWKSVSNEFAVLSTIPLDTTTTTNKLSKRETATAVPRQCIIEMKENGVPNYSTSADAYVEGLSRPLLSHAWSAAFSFAKCHLDETVPYDPFSYYAMPVEQFVRYARMWTRGYDTYTPTKNYVYHDYGEQKNGHGDWEWFTKFQKNRFRIQAIDRAKLILELPGRSVESDAINADRANLGLYGLGQRRTLDQMKRFINYQMDPQHDNLDKGKGCVEGHSLVKYDVTISPLANLYYEGATKMDPYPIFPLRTSPVFSNHHVTSAEIAKHLPDRLDTDNLEISVNVNQTAEVVQASSSSSTTSSRLKGLAAGLRHESIAAVGPELLEQSNVPPSSVLFVLWIFGLMIWYFVFAVKQNSINGPAADDKSWLSKAQASATTSAKANTGGRKKLVKDV